MSRAELCDLKLIDEKSKREILNLWNKHFTTGFREFLSRNSFVDPEWFALDVSTKKEQFRAVLEKYMSSVKDRQALLPLQNDIDRSILSFEDCITKERAIISSSNRGLQDWDHLNEECINCDVRICKLKESIENWKVEQRLDLVAVEDEILCCPGKLECNLLALISFARTVCDELYQILEKAHHKMIRHEKDPELKNRYQSVVKYAFDCICKLSEICFIVLRQPDQVFKQGNKNSMTVSLLAGWNHEIPCEVDKVNCQIYTETQLAEEDKGKQPLIQEDSCDTACVEWDVKTQKPHVHERPDATSRSRGPPKRPANSVVSIAAQKFENAWHADFYNVHWKKKNNQKRGNNVVDLKYALVFTADLPIKLKNKTLIGTCSLRCISLPLVCLVHSDNQPRARGTIFWYNSFGIGTLPKEKQIVPDNCIDPLPKEKQVVAENSMDTSPKEHVARNTPFMELESVKWSELMPMLKIWFEKRYSVTMSEERLISFRRLMEHIFFGHDSGAANLDLNTNEVRRSHFLDASANRQSLWGWLYASKKLLVGSKETFLSFIWQQNYVHFMTQQQAEEKLKQSGHPADTLIIRLCNHRESAISITQGSLNSENQPVIDCIGPWDEKDLSKLSLDQRLDGNCGRKFILSLSGELVQWNLLLEHFRDFQAKSQDPKGTTSQANTTPAYYQKTGLAVVEVRA